MPDFKNDNDFNEFVDLGSCMLSMVHNGYGKGLESEKKPTVAFSWT